MGGLQLSVKCVCVIVTSFCLLFGCSLTLASQRGWQNCHTYVLWRYFLQYEELGFSPLLFCMRWGKNDGNYASWRHLASDFPPVGYKFCCVSDSIWKYGYFNKLLHVYYHYVTCTYISVYMYMWRPQAITPSGWSWGFYVQRDRATPSTTVSTTIASFVSVSSDRSARQQWTVRARATSSRAPQARWLYEVLQRDRATPKTTFAIAP